MFRKIYLIAVLLLHVLSAAAQKPVKSAVSGAVHTSDGKPAAYVAIQLKDTAYGTTTDAEGHFQFSAPAGHYTLVVQSLTTHRRELPVTIRPDRNNELSQIEVQENVDQLEQVVITGQFSPQSIHNSLYKVRAINSEQIRMKAPSSLQSLLNTEIGIRLSNDMALGETDFELMGMSGNNVKILLDGIPLLDRGATKQSLSQLDINSIERVEIVEGPMSVVYGTDALAGVINIITRKGESHTGKSSWSVGARMQEESMGNEYAFIKGKGIHNESVDLGYNNKHGLFVNAGFSRNDHGGWKGDLTGREKRWHPRDQSLANGVIGYRSRDISVWYRLDFVDETIFGPLNGSELTPDIISDKDFLTKRYTHQMQAEWRPRHNLSLNAAISYQDYERRTQTTVTDLSSGEKYLSAEDASQDVTAYTSWMARATASWRPSEKFSLQPGIEYQWTQGRGGRIDGAPEISDLALFLSAEYTPWHWASFRPGVRTFLSASYNAPAAVPSFLTKFTLAHNLDLRLSYAYGFRTPTLQELYFSFHNDNHDIDGNPDLKAEYSHNITGSFTWRALHNERIRLTATLTGFYNIFRDRITLMESADTPNYNTYYNADRYKTLGGTLETSLVWKGLRANVSASLIGRYNRYSADDTSLSPFRYSPEVSASIGYQFARSGTGICFFYKYTGTRKEYYYHTFTNADNKTESEIYLRGLPGYHYGDVTVTQKITRWVSATAGVKNIFNLTSIRTIVDSVNDTPSISYLGCGTSWFVGLNFRLGGDFK